MQNMVYYMTNEVIEPRWHDMESKLRACRTMDEVLHHHTELLNTVLKECLLTEKELLKTLNKIMTICLLFADQMKIAEQISEVNEQRMRDESISSAEAGMHGSQGAPMDRAAAAALDPAGLTGSILPPEAFQRSV